MLIVHAFGPRETHIYCESGHGFVKWVRWTTFNQYAKVTPAVIPDEPLF